MSLYERLGVRPVVNAAAAQTILGGSLMSDAVLAAMRDAAGFFVSYAEFHDRVGELIAELSELRQSLLVLLKREAIRVLEEHPQPKRAALERGWWWRCGARRPEGQRRRH